MSGDDTIERCVGQPGTPPRVMLLYWGRRGALSRFTYELGRTALANAGLRATISVSRQNESFDSFVEFHDALFPIDTFAHDYGAVANAWRIVALRQSLVARLKRDRTQAVVALMPHVWMPLVAPVIKRAGVRFVSVIHDADAHSGDPTKVVHGWGLRELDHADLVLTLSSAVAGRLEATGRVPRAKLRTLFHPDLSYGPISDPQPPAPGEPFRLLSLGRILPYKGLPLLLDALDIVRAQGLPVKLGVFGEGRLDHVVGRLKAMDAEVVNRWLTEDEIGGLTRRFHAVVLSHIDASQSGVAATALGGGIPIISTPVGGLPEQVGHGRNGLVAENADAKSLAAAITQLYNDPQLYRTLCTNISVTREQRSMRRFVDELTAAAVGVCQ